MSINDTIHQHLTEVLKETAGGNEREGLEYGLRLLARWRTQLIQNTLFARYGAVVQSGPFKGMTFVDRSAEGCYAPKIVGSYEQELHPHIEAAIARGYGHVVNIGMAEGYYATGMALRLPDAIVDAFDLNEETHPVARRLAAMNGVADRVRIGGRFCGDDFSRYPAGDTLVICDIEGAEDELLDPQLYPALAGFDIIVELHECPKPGLSDRMAARFAATHNITRVPHGGREIPDIPILQEFGHLDQLLTFWEWRSGPTPWAVMINSTHHSK